MRSIVSDYFCVELARDKCLVRCHKTKMSFGYTIYESMVYGIGARDKNVW